MLRAHFYAGGRGDDHHGAVCDTQAGNHLAAEVGVAGVSITLILWSAQTQGNSESWVLLPRLTSSGS